MSKETFASVRIEDRQKQLDKWLEDFNARELWRAKPKGTQVEATMYAVNSWLVMVLRYNDGGWEMLAPITKSNSVWDTLRDVTAFVTGEVQERHPAPERPEIMQLRAEVAMYETMFADPDWKLWSDESQKIGDREKYKAARDKLEALTTSQPR